MSGDRRRRRGADTGREAGFSLIELMVVITIIGLLSGIVGVNVINYMKRASIQTTKSQLIAIENAINNFRLNKRRLPESLDELVGGEDAELNADEVPLDAWDNPFIYEPQGNRDFILMSLGADNLEGGEGEDADIDRKAAHRKTDKE